ncbi:mfs monosaccharide transporter [Pyrenophora seminiperda CCB06]|uniref:Mfs monosaccharide transporter n=1 Tax=Pyrenophora seminiperda CCB06 TaxID=1302712 RepID=A0A3M7MA50_9PLEO|nr:mfs monosaccharide transporter [Pyrenophora seminiperda CCB06]
MYAPGRLPTEMSFLVEHAKQAITDKQTNVVIFSATAIALYGYDQGMMSLINTNKDYLATMGLTEESPMVGVIVAVYYLGCAVGAVLFSKLADALGRKKSIFFSLATASLGNGIMFVAGMGALGKSSKIALSVMLAGRVIMGLGVGGIDAVIPTYSSELSSDDSRGKALAQEFQSNIFGLVMAFGINLGVTILLGKWNQWAWRIPIIVMQVYPVLLMAFVERLPESPRWFIFHDRQDDAKEALDDIYGDEAKEKLDELLEQHEKEKDEKVGYWEMLTPGHPQFHPTMITVMCQVNQALTGYGAVSVYGPQIFELLGFSVRNSEYLTLGNYTSYFFLMTFAWLLIDALGRRKLLLQGSIVLSSSFALLALFGGLVANAPGLHIPVLVPGIIGTVILFVATGAFGIGWLSTVWLFPTEVFPTTARAQGTAISVIIWGLANFAITFLTPVLFNNLDYFIFLVFAATNAFAGLWTYLYLPETGGRTFDENMDFFKEAAEQGTWRVAKVGKGEWKKMLYPDPEGEGNVDAERVPLLTRVEDQVPSVE